jgi:hypothetical protein
MIIKINSTTVSVETGEIAKVLHPFSALSVADTVELKVLTKISLPGISNLVRLFLKDKRR